MRLLKIFAKSFVIIFFFRNTTFIKHICNLFSLISQFILDNENWKNIPPASYSLRQFSKSDYDTKYYLYKVYCMSLYGCQLWHFESRDMNYFYTECCKAIRRLYNVTYNSHCALLHFFMSRWEHWLPTAFTFCKVLSQLHS